jgi:hypothetical protein
MRRIHEMRCSDPLHPERRHEPGWCGGKLGEWSHPTGRAPRPDELGGLLCEACARHHQPSNQAARYAIEQTIGGAPMLIDPLAPDGRIPTRILRAALKQIESSERRSSGTKKEF